MPRNVVFARQDMNEHVQEVQRLVGEILSVSPAAIDPNADLFSEFGMDSLGLFNLVVELEEKHDVSFLQEDYPTLVTVGAVAAYLDQLIRARSEQRA